MKAHLDVDEAQAGVKRGRRVRIIRKATKTAPQSNADDKREQER